MSGFRSFSIFLWVVPLLLVASGTTHAQFRTQRVASGLEYPIYTAAPPGDTARLFIVDWTGKVFIRKNGAVLPEPFLDVSELVFWDAWERGLFCIAFDPDYDQNGWFYLYFINNQTPLGSSAIRRFTVSADPDVADPASIHNVFTLPQAGSDHNGGHIEFAPDGTLWLGLGDGGVAPNTRSQELDNLFGKMIRIDPYSDDFPEDPKNDYAIPPDNPFVGVPGARGEIWSYGLRNPYRFAFDELTGDLYIGDVGHGFWEEIDFEPAGSPGGLNYGWPFKEGNHCYNPDENCDPGGLTDPIFEYPHPEGFSVTGGRVYRGSALPSLQGLYFFGDYITDRVWTLRVVDGQAEEVTDRTDEAEPIGLATIDNVVSFGKDGSGELHIADLGSGENGEIFRIVPDPGAVAAPVRAPRGLRLSAPFPNPFRARTSAVVHLGSPADLRVTVHSAAGRLVRELRAGPAAGTVAVTWDGRDAAGRPLSAGVYFLRIRTPAFSEARRMTLVR